MGGFGAMSGMIASIKENQRLRRERQSERRNSSDTASGERKPLVFDNKMSAEEQTAFHQKVIRKKRKEIIIMAMGWLFALVATLALILWIVE